MSHRIDPGILSKRHLKETFEHFGGVSYVDLHNKVVQQVTLRFNTQSQLMSFLAKATTESEIEGIEALSGRSFIPCDAFKRALT